MEDGEAVLRKIVVVANLGIDIIETGLPYSNDTMFNLKVAVHVSFVCVAGLANVNVAVVI